MKRLFAVAAVSLYLAGCHAPTPTMDSIAPYGTATVPPPSTGAVGTSADYYAPPPAPTAAATPDGQPTTPASGYATAPGAFADSTAAPMPTRAYDPAVQPAAFNTATASSATALPSSTTTSGTSTLKLNGMRVNDGTVTASQVQPPGAPVNLATLPDAQQVPSFMQILAPGSGGNPYTPPPVAQPSPTPAAPPSGSLNWQAR